MAKKKARSMKKKSTTKKSAKKRPAKRKNGGVSARKSTPTAATTSSSSSVPPPSPFVWHELMTNDVGRCKRFYQQMFGWSNEDTEMMPGFIYTLFKKDGKDVGGMMSITPEMGDLKPHWLQYVGVNDVDKAAERCEALGGQICVPAHDIPVGRFAVLRDPTGAEIAIFKSSSM